MDTTVTVTKAATKSGNCILSSTSPSPSSSSFYANNNNTNNSSNNEEEEDSMIHHHQHEHQQSQTSSTSIMPMPYSFCILWSPLHPITAFFPFIGHMGISDSKGHSHDFQGPYYVGTDHSYPLPRMAFGYPTRYLRIQIDVDVDGISDNRVATSSEQQQQQSHRWDDSIGEANEIYKQRMHNICCDNCHSHVAKALNIMEYKGRHDWDMIKLCFLLFFQGSFVPSNTSGGGSAGGGNISSYISSILLQFGPFLVILLLIILLSTKILS